MDNRKHKVKVEYGVAIAVLVVGLWFVIQAFTIETSREAVGPRTMPMLLAVAMVLSGLWLGFRALTGRTGDVKEGYGFLESDVPRIFMVIGCGAFFILMFWAFGYFTALICTFIAAMLTFGVRNLPVMVIGAIVMAIAFQAVFMGVMRLNDPRGTLVDMRPYTNWITGAQ